LNSILVHLEQVVPYDSARVFLCEGEWLHIVVGRGSSLVEKEIVGRQYPADSALYHEIRATGHPIILTDALADPRFQGWDDMDDIRGWMGVPLMVRNEVIGYLTLESRQVGAYDQVEAALVQAFANQAAVAIQNARLFEQVRVGWARLQSLSRRLVEVQERERRYVARELHDEAGQALTSLIVGLRLLEREADCPETVVARVAELKRMTNEVLENLHRLAMDLRPASLDHLGLFVALRQYIEAFGQQHSLTIEFEAVGLDEKRLPPTVEINLYRIVQEALTNVIRHAQATHVGVLLKRRHDQMVIIVEDNGIGFEPEKVVQSGRLGLLGMHERAEMLGGALTVESTVGTGTTIFVEVPYVYSHSNS
jgi:signal transduction histidine kinase